MFMRKKSRVNILDYANMVLKEALDEEIGISNMKLNKLLYIIYVEYLKKTERRLFSESFQVWQTGFVSKTVYETYRTYRGNYITKIRGNYYIDKNVHKELRTVFDEVWGTYKLWSAEELVKLTTMEYGSWWKLLQREQYVASDDILLIDYDYI